MYTGTLCIEKKSKHRFFVICSLLFSTTNNSNLIQFPLKFRRCADSTVVKRRMNGLVSSQTVYVPRLDWFIDHQGFAVVFLRQYLSLSSAFFLLTCSWAIWSTKSSLDRNRLFHLGGINDLITIRFWRPLLRL